MEIIDDLQRDGLVIVRSDSRFAYGHDAVLLTDFVRAHAGERYLDIGTGTGILAILTYAKCGVSFVAADIRRGGMQPAVFFRRHKKPQPKPRNKRV